VPSQVVSVIGGTATGGALKTQPLEWSDLYLQYVFNPALERPPTYIPPPTYVLATANDTNTTTQSPTPNASPSQTQSPLPTATPKSKSNNTGPIVGGVIGGVAVLALLALLIFCCISRSKRRRTEEIRRSELPTYQETKDDIPVEIADRAHHHDPIVEMPIPGPPTPLGWHDDRVGESGDNVTPMIGELNDNHAGDVWGGVAGRNHRRVGSDSRVSDISNDSGNSAIGGGRGSSPSVSPRIPRREVGTATR
jgi:hypothetical protein